MQFIHTILMLIKDTIITRMFHNIFRYLEQYLEASIIFKMHDKNSNWANIHATLLHYKFT